MDTFNFKKVSRTSLLTTLTQTECLTRSYTDSFACANLAKKKVTPSAYLGDLTERSGKQLAAANADSSAIFAMAMYMDQWDWSAGIAQNSLGM